MAKSQRQRRVSNLVQQIVASQLLHELGAEAAAVNIRAVDVTPDLRKADIWVGIVYDEPERRKAIMDRLQEIRPALQSAVAHGLKTKFTPRLELREDKSGAYSQHIEEILRDI